eukprot:TRINITY_DN101006_c0_g1_i1.p1 TRINITY_DN101006_c0_g1~~TRINITY_DN101006_c0_g1_i1.p1  ORF type:complete len:508 (+),score=87.85 TRINITY_DN101006_c0_g1_i1:140-1663(+)
MAVLSIAPITRRLSKRCSRLVEPLKLASFTLILWLVRQLYKRFRHVRGCPKIQNGGLPILGNCIELLKAVASGRHLDILDKYHRDLGPTVVWRAPGSQVVTTCDPKNVEHILKVNFNNYPKGSHMYNRLADLLGDGIFNVDGHLWHSQRKTASRMFNETTFKNHIWKVIDRNCTKVLQILRGTPSGQTVKMFNLMNRFTLDTIGEVGFAKSIDTLEHPESPFLSSFDRAQQLCFMRFVQPWWWFQKLLGLGGEKEATYHFKALSEYADTVVQDLKSDLDGEKGDSFVGLFMKDAAKNNEKIDDAFMRDMVLNFLIAGRDTTAQATTWCFFLIAQHPEVEEKILAEAKEQCGDRDPTYEDVKRMKYVQAVINEGLRLFPSVPLNDKLVLHDDTLPDGTFVPRGSIVRYNSYSMGRNTDVWGPDAAEFKPHRWLEMEEVPSSYAWPAFHGGPRECLGKRLAQLEMKACLVRILRAVKIQLAVPPSEIRYDTQLTIGMSTDLPCFVQARA